ncbi:MAG: hypothetical protein Kow0065_22220 [Methylomicrobium sp.]
MMPLFSSIIAGLSGLIVLYAVGYNLYALLQSRRGNRNSSPILLITSLFTLIGLGQAQQAWPALGEWIWFAMIPALLLDPVLLYLSNR